MNRTHLAFGLGFLALVGCRARADAPRAAADSTATAPPVGMELKAMPMLPGFRAHVDSLAHIPKMTRSGMSQHQAEVKHLVDAMHSDMMELGLPNDAAYDALADSVVKGSVELGSAAGADFNRRVARHVDQLRRLTAAYETKTAAMK